MGDTAITQRFKPLLFPPTVAIVGASSAGGGRQNVVMRRLRAFGYKDALYPIHSARRSTA